MSDNSDAPDRMGYSLVAIDLREERKALFLGKRIAERIGRAVTVYDASGALLAIFPAPIFN